MDSEGTIIELKYNLVDINLIDENDLFSANTSLAYGLLIEKNKGKEKLIKILNKIAENCDSEMKEIKMKRIIKYILEPVIGEKETKEMLEKFNKMGGDEVMTAVECLIRDIEREKEEGRKEGRKEGIKEGIKEGRKQTSILITKELMKIGMDIDRVCEITKLKKSEIEES